MAFTAPPPGSIASRPTIKKGGVRSSDESPEDFAQRMASRQASNAAPAPAQAPAPTRRDIIIAARADDTFDAKRNALNAGTAQHGRTMDEAGNISTVATAAPRPSAPLVPGGGQPAAPAPSPAPAAPSPVPMGPPSTTSFSGGKMSLTPQAAPPPASRLAQRQQLRTSSPAPVAPPPRKGGMINDGQGFRPASEVNASLRAAQDARAAQAANPPAPAPKPASTPNTMANWTPEEEKAALAAARARETSTAPKKNQPEIGIPTSQLAGFDGKPRLTKLQRDARANQRMAGWNTSSPTPIQPPKPGAAASPVMHPSTPSSKPRFVPPGSLLVGL